ncbi:hypothetical protein BGZ88_002591 [Linnemannia elongata]|nr:hypothetical protein BGZ88_002591 [Linnemannia elongata]
MKSKSVTTVLAVVVVTLAYATTGVNALWCGCQRNGLNTGGANSASYECYDEVDPMLQHKKKWGNNRCDAGDDETW